MTGGERPQPIQTNNANITDTVVAKDAAYNLDDCAAATGVTFNGDQGIDNQTLCYQARAEQLNDWASCLQISADPPFVPAECLVGVATRTSTYLCDQHPQTTVRETCNQLFMSTIGNDPTLHQFTNLETYKVAKVVALQRGEDFNVQGVAIEVDESGVIAIPDYYPANTHQCTATEDPPLAVGTGIVGAYIYLTGCTKTENGIQINYFKYNLPGLIFPKDI